MKGWKINTILMMDFMISVTLSLVINIILFHIQKISCLKVLVIQSEILREPISCFIHMNIFQFLHNLLVAQEYITKGF